MGELDAVATPGWTSLLPALVTIVLAFATRQVIVALFAGIVTGSLVLFGHSRDWADLNLVERLLLPAIGTKSFAQILLIYLWCLGGLVGLWEKTGAALHFAEEVGRRVARGPRSGLFFGWLIGVLFHQGGTVSTVLAGTTVKPVTDRHHVSHEELAYVVDSTASPIATVIPLNAWPGYIATLVVGTIPLLADEAVFASFYLKSLAFNFYALIAVTFTFLFAFDFLPWIGSGMRRARIRSRTHGQLDAPDAEPLRVQHPGESGSVSGYQPHLLDFVAPIGILISIALFPRAFGWSSGYLINEAFLASALTAMLLPAARGMPLREVIDGFVRGCQSMTIGAIVLALAVTLGTVAKSLHTADFIISAVGAVIPLIALPAILTFLCMGIAFSTGTSWGTYAVVFPLAMPLAYAMNPDPLFLHVCFGAVLGGAVFGDQCSPISDTTILSSMFTGCDLMDHVKTQLPLAFLAACLGAVLSTLVVALLG